MTFTSPTTVDAATAEYLARCDEHLRDLPPAIQAQLRQDIAEIVDEVCGELGGSPTELVGPPGRFVAELRAAAGWPLPSPTSPGETEPEGHSLRDLVRTVREHRAVLWTLALLPELRPASWVLRGYLVAVAIGRITGAPRQPEWLLGLLPYWPVIGSRLLGLATVASAIYISVEAGRRPLSRRRRLGRVIASIISILTAMTLAGDLKSHSTTAAPYVSPPDYLEHDHGPPPDAGVPFEAVHIGSDLTGDRIEVLDLPSAETVLDRLLQDSPPAAVFIDRAGERVRPGNRDNWRIALQALVKEGALSPEAVSASS